MTSIISALLMGVMMITTVAATWQQSNPHFGKALSRFHFRQSPRHNPSSLANALPSSLANAQTAGDDGSLMNLSYGREVLGPYHNVLGDRILAIPLRLDYSHRSGATTKDERRIILCLYWPDIAEIFPNFPFDKVCQ